VEIEKTRDFVIMHYHVTEREDSEFWRHCRHMKIPDSLAHRIQLFRENAYAFQADSELFRVDSWSQVLLGQRVMPKSYHHFARAMNQDELIKYLGDFRQAISQTVSRMPAHQDFVNQYCKAEQSVWN
jgi:tryptophan halogenase